MGAGVRDVDVVAEEEMVGWFALPDELFEPEGEFETLELPEGLAGDAVSVNVVRIVATEVVV